MQHKPSKRKDVKGRRSFLHEDVVSVQDAAQRLVAGVDFIETMVEHVCHHHLRHTHTHTVDEQVPSHRRVESQ